jgi:hypothetical protein
MATDKDQKVLYSVLPWCKPQPCFFKHGILKSLLLLVSNNNPSASAVAIDSAVADVIAAVGFPGVPAVVVASSIASVPACCC